MEKMNWYLIQTKPNAHPIAIEHLTNQNFEVFLPLVLRTSRAAKKFKTNSVPLFQGYLFLGSLLRSIPWKSVNATRGVARVVTLDGKYRPVDNKIIEGLKSRCDRNNIIRSGNKIKPGEKIKIQRGPFSDFIGEVEKIDSSQRVWILLDLMHQKALSTVSIDDIAQIN